MVTVPDELYRLEQRVVATADLPDVLDALGADENNRLMSADLATAGSPLLDQAIGEAGQLRILRVLTKHFNDFDELGDIRTRQLGGKMMVELHLGFENDWSVEQARQAVGRLTKAVKKEFTDAGDEVDVAVVLLPAGPADETAYA